MRTGRWLGLSSHLQGWRRKTLKIRSCNGRWAWIRKLELHKVLLPFKTGNWKRTFATTSPNRYIFNSLWASRFIKTIQNLNSYPTTYSQYFIWWFVFGINLFSLWPLQFPQPTSATSIINEGQLIPLRMANDQLKDPWQIQCVFDTSTNTHTNTHAQWFSPTKNLNHVC